MWFPACGWTSDGSSPGGPAVAPGQAQAAPEPVAPVGRCGVGRPERIEVSWSHNPKGAERQVGGFALAPQGGVCPDEACRFVDRDAFGAWAERTAEQVAFPSDRQRRSPHLKRVTLTLTGSTGRCRVSDGPITSARNPKPLRELVDELSLAWEGAASPARPAP